MSREQTASAWPEGVIARYLTVGGATVDILDNVDSFRSGATHRVSARCSGATCPWNELGCSFYAGHHLDSETFEEDWFRSLQRRCQQHAEKCRAMPKPPEVAG